MKSIKKLDAVEIFQKRSGRYAVKNKKSGKWLQGEEKVKILSEHKLIKLTAPKPKETPAQTAPEAAKA
ncbi:MAG: hypothetical protein KDD48_08055, partial [Bdellovibrionales bacterium]|nr:hypothetical protein [Bdellovibrionales bacterium]